MMKFLDRIHEILIFFDFGGPAGGSRAWKGASPPTNIFYMTRKGFYACRVILVQGKFDFQGNEIMWAKPTFQVDKSSVSDTGIR